MNSFCYQEKSAPLDTMPSSFPNEVFSHRWNVEPEDSIRFIWKSIFKFQLFTIFYFLVEAAMEFLPSFSKLFGSEDTALNHSMVNSIALA